MSLTPNEESMLRDIEHTEAEIERLRRIRVIKYREFMKVLGIKASCDLCGNQHWPLCKEIE